MEKLLTNYTNLKLEFGAVNSLYTINIFPNNKNIDTSEQFFSDLN